MGSKIDDVSSPVIKNDDNKITSLLSSKYSLNEESGYSSDSSSASSNSQRMLKLKSALQNEVFLTPGFRVTSRIRISSTPYPASELRQLQSPDIEPICSPYFRRRKLSSPSCLLYTEQSEDATKVQLSRSTSNLKSPIKTRVKEFEEKCLLIFRSPLKSPSKFCKKHRSESDKMLASDTVILQNKEGNHKVVRRLVKDCCGECDRTTLDSDSTFEDSGVVLSDSSKFSIKPTLNCTPSTPSKSSCIVEKGRIIENKLKQEPVTKIVTESGERMVKQLFFNKVQTPIRRVSPRLSNIILRLMNDASFLLPKIFNYLDAKDLIHISQVNRCFHQTIAETTHLQHRIEKFIEEVKRERNRVGKENLAEKVANEGSLLSLTLSSPRKHFQQLQNTAASPKKPQQAASMSLFDKFVREGKKLLPGETQQKCVQCQNPARVFQSECKAACTKESCGFVYCIRCLLPYHSKPSECVALKPRPRVTSATKILTKACKKRLRRL